MIVPSQYNWIQAFANGDKIDSIYMIEMRRDATKYFFLTLATTQSLLLTQVLWTPSLNKAWAFTCEEDVEEFKADYISPRKVSIIRISTPQVYHI